MADTQFLTDNALTVHKWSAVLFKEALADMYLSKFIGKDDKSIIQTKSDLEKEQGDKITFALRMKLAGAGQTGDSNLEGNEEALVFHNFPVKIDLRGHSVKAAGKMTMKRTKFDIKNEAKNALADWMSEILDKDLIYALSGLANPVGTIAVNSPSTNRKWYGGQSTGGVVTAVANDAAINSNTAHLFGTEVISTIKRKAELSTPKIRPVNVAGKEYFVCYVHPYQAKALRAEAAWQQAQREAMPSAKDNPIFSGALGIWDQVVIQKYGTLETRLGAGGSTASEYFESGDNCANGINVARALFCGAQAGVIAYGQYPGWYEKMFQYGRVPGVATDVIYGVAKTEFNSEDFGVITVDTAIVTD